MVHFRNKTLIAQLFFCTVLFIVPRVAFCDVAHKTNDLTDKEVLGIVFSLAPQNIDAPLGCDSIGTDVQDSTIGEYLSGFWSFHTERSVENFLRIEKEGLTGIDARVLYADSNGVDGIEKDEHLWLVDFYICGKDDSKNMQWCWGVRFLVRKNDKSVVPGSLWCIGAG
jgi:hypothetical protein